MSDAIIHFWEIIALTSIGIIITLIGSWLVIGKNMVTRAEVSVMIETQSIYALDRPLIMERLATNKETLATFSIVIDRNTEVMTDLKVQIATLGKTLETLERKI